MSTYSTIVIHRTDDADLEEVILTILCDETDRGNDAEVWRRADATWLAEFKTKYTVDGLANAAEKISSILNCAVDVVEEWDGSDADEQGREAYSYEHGVKVTEERVLDVPAGVEVRAVPVETLRQWRGWLEQQPFPQIGRVATAIDVLLS